MGGGALCYLTLVACVSSTAARKHKNIYISTSISMHTIHLWKKNNTPFAKLLLPAAAFSKLSGALSGVIQVRVVCRPITSRTIV